MTSTANTLYETTAENNLTRLVENGCTQAVLDFEPSCREFLEVLGIPGWVLLGIATFALVVIIGLYVDTVIYVMKYSQKRRKANTAIVLSVYPVLGLCSYLGLLFQKANLFLDACAQLWFALCMWQFLILTLNYFGGETRFVTKMKGTVLPWKGPPCCCWPCCRCPTSTVTKSQIRFVKILVMQHPWVQLVVFILQVTFWIEGWYTHMSMRLTNAYIYIYLFATTSFFFGLWAFIVGFKASLRQLQEFHYLPKIIAFQLCLVFLRLQTLIVNSILVPSGAIPCLPPISPSVFANVLLNSLLLGQLVVLCVLARHFYKMPIPDMVSLEVLLNDDKIDSEMVSSNDDQGSSSTLPTRDDNGIAPNGKSANAADIDRHDEEPLLDENVVTTQPA